jgi:hypothetical protein
MITNVYNIPNKFKCKKLLANYLQYERNLPLLSVEKNDYWFTDNSLLREILQNLPLWLKILNKF